MLLVITYLSLSLFLYYSLAVADDWLGKRISFGHFFPNKIEQFYIKIELLISSNRFLFLSFLG